MIPTTLDGWTLDVVRDLVAQGVFESDQFDFKERLPHAEDKAAKMRLRKACAAFANSQGGFLVFGVKDDRDLDLGDRLEGVDSGVDFPVQFGDFPSGCQPSVEWRPKNPAIQIEGGSLIHVVHVPQSRRRPHGVLDDERWWFPKRTNKGSEPMSLEEVRDAFVDTSRRNRDMHLLVSELKRMKTLAERLNIEAGNRETGVLPPDLWTTRYSPSLLVHLLPSVFDVVGGSESLVRHLGEIREAAESADNAMAGYVTSYSPLKWTEAQAADCASVVSQYARRVLFAATWALQQLERIQA